MTKDKADIRKHHPLATIRGLAPLTALALLCTVSESRPQGTLTVTFDTGSTVPAPGSMSAISEYTESGVIFYNPYGPNNLIAAGSGVVGYPNDGTDYLLCPPGANLGFTLTSPAYFGLDTLDLAAYSASQSGPFNLDVVGYGPMGLMVTNVLIVDTLADRRANTLPDFQTFTLDSTFEHIYRVDILGNVFALDNVIVTGVPEPSSGAVLLLGTVCAFWFRRGRRRRREAMKSVPLIAARSARLVLLAALALRCVAQVYGQGTMTVTFEGQPRGTTLGPIGVYSESGMQFAMAYGPGSLILSGGGIAGYPDNGTGYLEMPDGIPGGNGATRFEFGFNAFPQSFPLTMFNLVSFDAAAYWNLGPQTLEVVGYHPMAGSVTNYFTVGSQFQTCYLDSSFNNVFLVDVFNARWSLDNLVISGVPEPSSVALVFLGTACALWFRRRWSARRR